MKKVIISTGGTGGHIYPALAVAQKLREKDVEVIFIGSKYRMEKELVPQYQFKFIGMPVKPFSNISSILRLAKCLIQAMKIIKQEKPDAVIGFGNYISVPVILAAFLKRVDFYLHEQNVGFGFANKIFYAVSKKTFLSYDSTLENLPIKYHNKVIVTGNPVRKEFCDCDGEKEREVMKADKDETVILIIGGSLGAKSINDAVLKNWDSFFSDKNMRLYWATGRNNFAEVNEKLKKIKQNDIIKPYFENIAPVMAAADIVVGRAGATSISEAIAAGKPCILIPYGSEKVGQWENAKMLVAAGAAEAFDDREADKAIERIFTILKEGNRLEIMAEKIKDLRKEDAAQKIVNELEIWRH